MPATSLPTEILEHITDVVACDADPSRIYDLLSLSICCKALVPRNQWGLPVWSKHFQRTARFVETVAGRPYLGGHVQTLTCTFTGERLSTDNAIFSAADAAFRSMENVQRLTLAHSQPKLSTRFWRIILLLQYSRGCPPLIHHLRHLTLLNCGIGFSDSLVYWELRALLRQIPRLQSLTCDHYSLAEGIDPILSYLPAQNSASSDISAPCDLISGIENLDLGTGHIGLRLRCDEGPNFPSLLSNLNPESFSTLSHLTIRIFSSLETRYEAIRTPYGRSWSEILPRIQMLEFLEFYIVFQGEFQVDTSKPGIFASGKHHFPHLREVKTTVHVRLIEDDYMEERDRTDAEEFRKNIQNLVYPPISCS
ncbi:hypothetical protein FA13DRAFT_1744856 [Coprinellus micaceus]|uniref:Uncharacterized protein n=1 Tax=Coprinellus micaceus TaxID=71717 RepID=A0A4Y7SC66_COPMI|nr:hypothetical protein FA13DRAFT_1744856 [Coprinellus micaceus]